MKRVITARLQGLPQPVRRIAPKAGGRAGHIGIGAERGELFLAGDLVLHVPEFPASAPHAQVQPHRADQLGATLGWRCRPWFVSESECHTPARNIRGIAPPGYPDIARGTGSFGEIHQYRIATGSGGAVSLTATCLPIAEWSPDENDFKPRATATRPVGPSALLKRGVD